MRLLPLPCLMIPVSIGLTLAAPLSARAADSFNVIDVVSPATLDVQTGDSTSERVYLAGIEDGFGAGADGSTCVAASAVARIHDLIGGQPVSLEADWARSAQDQLSRQFVYVWLPDGSDLGEVLLREGLVRAEVSGMPLLHEQSLAAAQAAALSQRIGLWAPGACPAEPPPAGVEAFVKSTAEQAQVATTAVDILHQQTLSVSGPGSGLSQPRWRQGTAYAVAELQASAGALASASPGGPVQPLAQRFASIGRDLLAGADSYASASDLQDVGLLQASDGQLQASIAALQPLMQELFALAERYTFED
jgi:Staphylococcal nuclease homologue